MLLEGCYTLSYSRSTVEGLHDHSRGLNDRHIRRRCRDLRVLGCSREDSRRAIGDYKNSSGSQRIHSEDHPDGDRSRKQASSCSGQEQSDKGQLELAGER